MRSFEVLVLFVLLSSIAFADNNFRTYTAEVCGTIDPNLFSDKLSSRSRELIKYYRQVTGVPATLFCLQEPVAVERQIGGKIETFGTEYFQGDNGTVFVQVLDGNQGVDNASCELSVFYPNKTFFISTSMRFLNSSQGLYYHDFIAPNQTGVYMLESYCAIPLSARNLTTFFSRIGTENSLKNSTQALTFTETLQTIDINEEKCVGDQWEDSPDDFGGVIRKIRAIKDQLLWINTPITPRSAVISLNYSRQNFATNELVVFKKSSSTATINTSLTKIIFSDENVSVDFASNEKLVVELCIKNLGGVSDFTFSFGSATVNSSFVRDVDNINVSSIVEYRGGGEIHVNQFTNLSSLILSVNSSVAIGVNISMESAQLIANTTENVSRKAIAFGTEYYRSGEESRFGIQLVKGNNVVNDAECKATVYNPDLTLFLNESNMTFLSRGIYYRNFTVPSTDGLYVLDMECNKGGDSYHSTGELHVSSYITTNLTNISIQNLDIINRIIILNSTANDIKLNVSEILVISRAMNLTVTQTLGLTQQINLTTLQTLGIAIEINATTKQILGIVQHINLTTLDILNRVDSINLTANQIKSLSEFINLTTLDILFLSRQINATTLRNEYLLQQINLTTFSSNFTANEIRLLALRINATVNDTFILLSAMNLTQSQILALSQSINVTVNNTFILANGIYTLLQEVNATTQTTKTQVAQVLSLAEDINLTAKQILAFVIALNFTATDVLAITNHTHFEIHNLANVTQAINLSNQQILSIIQTINSTTTNTLAYVVQINQTTLQILADLGALNNSLANFFNQTNITLTGNLSIDVNALITALLQADVEEVQLVGGITTGQQFASTGLATGIANSVFGSVGFAAAQDIPVEATCTANNTALITSNVRQRCVNNNCIVIQTNTTTQCQFGCNDRESPNKCNPSPYQVNLGFLALIFVLFIALAIVVAKMRN